MQEKLEKDMCYNFKNQLFLKAKLKCYGNAEEVSRIGPGFLIYLNHPNINGLPRLPTLALLEPKGS